MSEVAQFIIQSCVAIHRVNTLIWVSVLLFPNIFGRWSSSTQKDARNFANKHFELGHTINSNIEA